MPMLLLMVMLMMMLMKKMMMMTMIVTEIIIFIVANNTVARYKRPQRDVLAVPGSVRNAKQNSIFYLLHTMLCYALLC